MRKSEAHGVVSLEGLNFYVHRSKQHTRELIADYWINPPLGHNDHHPQDLLRLKKLEKLVAELGINSKEWTHGNRPLKLYVRGVQVLMYIGTTSLVWSSIPTRGFMVEDNAHDNEAGLNCFNRPVEEIFGKGTAFMAFVERVVRADPTKAELHVHHQKVVSVNG
jgi:hypothetical protein